MKGNDEKCRDDGTHPVVAYLSVYEYAHILYPKHGIPISEML